MKRAALLALLVMPAVVWAQKTPAVRPLEHTRVRLSNGLVVLLNQDRSTPIIGVEVLYHVGSVDEPAGKSGMAHLCEHLMDLPSPKITRTHRRVIQEIGGTGVRGTAAWGATDENRTHFFYTVPSNELETVLWLESDRMAAGFKTRTARDLVTVREVVRQERLSSIENRPFGAVEEIVSSVLFDSTTRYPRGAHGSLRDIESVQLEELTNFCAPYYVPNNAVLSLSGDFDTTAAVSLIKRYFGDIPAGREINRPPLAATLTAERRLVLEDSRVETPRLRLVWPGAGFADADRVALNALAAVLGPPDPRLTQLMPGVDRLGRLSKTLIYDRQLATSVYVGNFDLEAGGFFQIEISPVANTSLSVIEGIVDSVLTALKRAPISQAEIEPFKRYNPVIAVTSLQTRAARADTLAQGEAYARDPVAYAKQADRALQLTPSDLTRVAQRYLTPRRVVMSLIAAGKLDQVSKPQLPYKNVTPKRT